MSSEETLRRASYGPNSPQIGRKGARTRQRIIDETLRLFEAKGFHETLVDEIAERSGVSRATLYQYFASKDEIFQELMEECGAALQRVVRRLGPLGPTEEGFDNLHWWLGEWAWVFSRYATMFAQWERVATVSAGVRPQVATFAEIYSHRVAKRLTDSGVTGVDVVDVGTILLVAVHRFNYYRYRGAVPGLTDQQLLDGLAVHVQLALFPETPAAVFDAIALDLGESTGVVSWPGPYTPEFQARFAALSDRARGTVDRLLDAACRVFSAYGYHMATVDDVVREAGVARGTFYKYFTDKPDALAAIAEEAWGVLPPLVEQFATLSPGDHDALLEWMGRYDRTRVRYVGLLRVWMEDQPLDDQVRAIGAEVGRRASLAFASVLNAVERDHPFNTTTGVLFLHALLERSLDGLTDESTPERRQEVVELLTWLIGRGLLNGRGRG
ncbi:TetR/AcrR family transcriptional regulator [Streptomyces sp. NPDC058231]|uniref:TetR/AcrR family transcriptional regulator n=1 Tax=Streptomyces sp. NPDC058231 TaxID=3346392 RepID=UPI0036E0FF6D